MVGSRRSGDFSRVVGKSRGVTRALQDVQSDLNRNTPAKIVVSTAVDVIAMSNPAIGTLVATYHVAKMAYNVATEAETTYQKTHSIPHAVSAAAKEIVKSGVELTVRSQV